MSLLPSDPSEFCTKSYWDSFFTQRSAAFEWYGSYSDDLRSVLGALVARTGGPFAGGWHPRQCTVCQVAAEQDALACPHCSVVVLGFGSSRLCWNLAKEQVRDASSKQGKDGPPRWRGRVIAVDFSTVAVAAAAAEQAEMRASGRPTNVSVANRLLFLEGDATQLDAVLEPHLTSPSVGQLPLIVDKGTLDAIASSHSSLPLDYLAQVLRNLAPNVGIFFAVTLLQENVLDAVMTTFSRGADSSAADTYCAISLCPFTPKRSSSPEIPFILSVRHVDRATHPAPLPPPLQLAGEVISSEAALLTSLKSCRALWAACLPLARVTPGRTVSVSLPLPTLDDPVALQVIDSAWSSVEIAVRTTTPHALASLDVTKAVASVEARRLVLVALPAAVSLSSVSAAIRSFVLDYCLPLPLRTKNPAKLGVVPQPLDPR